MMVEEITISRELIKRVFKTQKAHSLTLRRAGTQKRKQHLVALKKWIHENRTSIHEAMFKDFKKNPVEVDAIEIFHVLNEIKHALQHIDDWVKPKKIDAPITMLGTRASIYYEPRGVCLIISPWNYPFSLSVGPLVSAITAGNTVILKPSEATPHVSALLAKMATDLFAESEVVVFQGDAETSKFLLTLPFDHIFFTGSPAIGKEVMKAAAENLTSVTLELGGKSPTIVTASANLDDAAERISVAKFVNNGQTCVAPDYILADEKIVDKLLPKLAEYSRKMFAANNDFEKSDSYCRIVNDRHYSRIKNLIEETIHSGAKVELGGTSNDQTRFIHPMILSNVPTESRIMEEEIFGPVLPVVTYRTLEQAVEFINTKPKPLALYLYTTESSEKKKVLSETSAGATCINDSGIHFLHHGLPFGGVNNSGIGKSHGHYGFLAFSNEKSVLQQKSGFTLVKLFYPPYTGRSKKIMDWFLKFF